MIYLVSKNKKWCNLIRQHFEKEIWDQKISVHCTLIQDFVKEHGKEKTIYVSPTNSLGRMEGGIDLIMSRQIFPNIHRKLARLIKLLGIVGKTGQYILPVGSALFFPDHANKSGLITTPVMYNSSSIGHTENVYISILTTLILFQKINRYREKEEDIIFQDLVITSHGCGNGAMSEEESVRQFRQVFSDFDQFYEKRYQSLKRCKEDDIEFPQSGNSRVFWSVLDRPKKTDRYPYSEELEIEIGDINPHFFCILPYQEKEAEMVLIDQNEVKTIKIIKEYTIMDEE